MLQPVPQISDESTFIYDFDAVNNFTRPDQTAKYGIWFSEIVKFVMGFSGLKP